MGSSPNSLTLTQQGLATNRRDAENGKPSKNLPPAEFDKWSEGFQSHIGYLAATAEDRVKQAADYVHGRRKWDDKAEGQPDWTPDEAAAFILRGIEQRIEDCMAIYDRMLEAIGYPPRYVAWRKNRAANSSQWKKLSAVLEEIQEDAGATN